MRDGDKPHNEYTFTVAENEQVVVTMTGDDFDTYLVVRPPRGNEVSNDDFGSISASQISLAAPEPGTYTVRASAYREEGRGDYEIRVRKTRIRVLSTVAGRLDFQDMRQIKGEYFDTLTIRPPASGSFMVELVPLGFAGYLRVTSPGGEITRSESDGYSSEQEPIRIGPLAGAPGTWTVDVTSTSGDAGVGAYDLRVIQFDQ